MSEREMLVNSTAARIYLAAVVLLLPAPYIMPLSDLVPVDPNERMIVWPNVVFGSAAVAVIALLLGIFHQVHRMIGSLHRTVALVWVSAALIAVIPLPLWFPRNQTAYSAAIGVQALAAGAAVLALSRLAYDIWRNWQPSRWLAIIAISQVALLFAMIGYGFAHQVLVRDWAPLDEIIDAHIKFAAQLLRCC